MKQIDPRKTDAAILRDIMRNDDVTDAAKVNTICLKAFASPAQVGDTVNDFDLIGQAQVIELSLSVDVRHSDDEMIYLLNRLHCFTGNLLREYQNKVVKYKHQTHTTNAFTSTKSITK